MLDTLIYPLIKVVAAEAPELLHELLEFVQNLIVTEENKLAVLAAKPGAPVDIKVLETAASVAAPLANAAVAAAIASIDQAPANIPRDTSGQS